MGVGWPANSLCKLGKSLPLLGPQGPQICGDSLAQTMACGPFARLRSVSGSRCLPPLAWDLPSAAYGLALCTRDNKPWNGGLAAVGFPTKDLAGFPGGTPPHPDLARRCTCAVTHIAPCFPPGTGAAQACPQSQVASTESHTTTPPPAPPDSKSEALGAAGMTPGTPSSRVFQTCWFKACFTKVSPEAQYIE